MYLEVYIDVIFIINYIMDLLLLFIVKTILKLNTKTKRLVLGALAGGLCACLLAVFPALNGLLQFVLSYIGIVFLMIRITFGKQGIGTTLKSCLLLYISTFFLGGMLHMFYYGLKDGEVLRIGENFLSKPNTGYLLLSIVAGGCSVYLFICVLNHLRSKDLELYHTELYLKDKVVKIKGLLDTGNCLYDPIYRKPVLVTEHKVLQPLLGAEGMNNVKITMVPFHSVGSNGVMPAVFLDKVVVYEGNEQIKNENVLVAISKNRISKNDEYQIILHRDVM